MAEKQRPCSRCEENDRMGTLPCIFLCRPCYDMAVRVSARVKRGRTTDCTPVIVQRGRTISERPGHAGPQLPGNK